MVQYMARISEDDAKISFDEFETEQGGVSLYAKDGNRLAFVTYGELDYITKAGAVKRFDAPEATAQS